MRTLRGRAWFHLIFSTSTMCGSMVFRLLHSDKLLAKRERDGEKEKENERGTRRRNRKLRKSEIDKEDKERTEGDELRGRRDERQRERERELQHKSKLVFIDPNTTTNKPAAQRTVFQRHSLA